MYASFRPRRHVKKKPGSRVPASVVAGLYLQKKIYAIFKAGLPPKLIVKKKVTLKPESCDEDEPVITQEGLGLNADEGEQAMPSLPVYEHKMVDDMMQKTPMAKVNEAHYNPLPDCSFIRAAHILENPRAAITTTNTRECDLALKSEAMKVAKSRVFAKKKEAMLQAQLAAIEKKAAEATARKEKAGEAIARKEEAAITGTAKRRLPAVGKKVEKKAANAEKKPTNVEKKGMSAGKKPAGV